MSEETAVADPVEAESPSEETASDDVAESPSAETSDEAKAKDEGSTPAEKAEADAEPKEWANLLKKYDGDKDKAGKAYWKTVNDNAALAKENKELKAFKDAAEKAKNEKPAEPHPTLKDVDDYITALNKDLEKNLPTKEAQLWKAHKDSEKDIIRLEYELEKADGIDDKRTINAELRAAKAELKSAERDIRELGNTVQATQAEIKRAQQYKANFEKTLEEERANKAREAEILAQFNDEFPQEINGYIAKHAKALGFPTDDSESYEELKDSVYEYLMGYAAKYRGTDEPADADWNTLVENKMKREAAKADKYGRAHFQKVSKEAKPKVATPAVSKPATAPKASASPQFDDGLTPAMREARKRLASRGL
jgi:hypothetical protein